MDIFADVSETIERWFKVQMLWSNLEAVFLSGDIAKAMPVESKKFQQIDKNWIKIMERANETTYVVKSCQSEMLKQMLPQLQKGLEECQKSLDSYLESKRAKFPRF
jgi:dynein heavy chain